MNQGRYTLAVVLFVGALAAAYAAMTTRTSNWESFMETSDGWHLDSKLTARGDFDIFALVSAVYQNPDESPESVRSELDRLRDEFRVGATPRGRVGATVKIEKGAELPGISIERVQRGFAKRMYEILIAGMCPKGGVSSIEIHVARDRSPSDRYRVESVSRTHSADSMEADMARDIGRIRQVCCASFSLLLIVVSAVCFCRSRRA